MTVTKFLSLLTATTIVVVGNTASAVLVIPTNYGLGADVEVKEEDPIGTQNGQRGANNELGTRIRNAGASPTDDPADRNSFFYLQFDLTQLNPASDVSDATLRLTYRLTNMGPSRIEDRDDVDPDIGRVGMVYYGIPNTIIDEATLVYFKPPRSLRAPVPDHGRPGHHA